MASGNGQDPLGILTSPKSDPLGLLVPKKAGGAGSPLSKTDLPSGVSSSSIGYDNSQSSLPLIEPKQQIVQNTPNSEEEKAGKLIQEYYKHLSPAEQQTLDRIGQASLIRQQQDRLRVPSAEEIKQQHAMDTTFGKVKKSVTYLGSQLAKGGLDVVKGGAWVLNHLNTGLVDTQSIPDEAFKSSDKFTDFGITPTQKDEIENSKKMGWGAVRTVGMIANIAPAAIGGEAAELPKTAFALQGFGQGKDTMDEVDPEHKINPTVRDLFIAGSGLANGFIMGDFKENVLSKSVQEKVVSGIVSHAMQESAEKGLTEDALKESIKNTSKDFAEKFNNVLNTYAEKTGQAAKDFAALNAAQYVLKKGVDITSDKPVFNANLGQLMEQVSDVVTKQAPIFGGIGAMLGGRKPNEAEVQKRELGQQVADKDTEIAKFSEKTDDPVKNAENEVNLEQAKKEREELNNQLKNVILKQKQDEKSKNEGQSGQSTEAKKEDESGINSGKEGSSLQEGRKDDEVLLNQTGEAAAEPVSKEQDNAVQKQKAEGVPVQPKAEDSEGVPKGDTEGSKTAVESKKEGEENAPQEVKTKKLTLKRYEKKPPVSEVAKTMADKIRSLKSEKGKAYGGLQGVATAVYDGALETAATVIEQGGKLVDAIQAAINHIKKNSKEDDEDKIRKAVSEDLAQAGLVDRYEEPEMIEANNAFMDAKIQGKFGVEAVDHIIDKLKDTNLKNIVDKVKTKIKGDATYLESTRTKVLENEGGNEQDQAALLLDQYNLKSQEENLINEINKSTDPNEIKDLQGKLSKVQDNILDNATANRMIGREASTVFRLRQVAIDQDANLDYMREKYMASLGKKNLTPEQEEEVKQAYQKIREAEVAVKQAKEAEKKARSEADRLQQENDALKKIIEQAKEKHTATTKGSQDRLTQIRSSIDNSKKELGKIFGNVTSGGVLQPEIYKHLYNIVKGKAEELYVKTKSNIDLNHLVKETLKEIKDVAPDISEQDVRDAINGNYEKEARKPKTELQKNIAELKKQANLIKKINDVQNNIEVETRKKGESSPEVKKLQKDLADLKKEVKISGDYEAMQEGTLNTDAKQVKRPELDDRQKNINRYKQVQRQIKEIQGKIDRKEFTTPAQEAKKFEKSKELQAAEHELAVRKYLWDKKNKQELMKNRPMVNKIGDEIMRWVRFTALSRVSTLGKLATVVAQGVVSKPIKLAVQEAVARMTPKSMRGVVSGKVRPEAVAKYYSAFIRNFSAENLKNAFKGLDEADILYGRGKYMEDYDMGSGFYNDFLEAPGRAHGYLKSFLKKPETAFANEQLMQDHIEKYQDIAQQLKNEDLTDKQRADLEEKQKQYDVTNDEVRERINTLSAEHGKWSIFMNKNHGVEKFRNMLSAWTGQKQPSLATKAFGYAVKSDAPILKIPINYARRFFLYKYGLLKGALGTEWAGGDTRGLIGAALKGTDDMTDQQKELLSRSLTYGSYGAALFTLGIFAHKHVKRNDDGTMDVNGQHFNKTETNILTDSPGAESFLSGTDFGEHLGKKRDSWAKAWVESDIDVAKKMPFNSLLKYGFVSNVGLSLFQKDKDRALTVVGKAALQKLKNTLEPGAYQELIQILDPHVNERKPRNLKEILKKETPGLSKQVPR